MKNIRGGLVYLIAASYNEQRATTLSGSSRTNLGNPRIESCGPGRDRAPVMITGHNIVPEERKTSISSTTTFFQLLPCSTFLVRGRNFTDAEVRADSPVVI
jgi:hypothetical protein